KHLLANSNEFASGFISLQARQGILKQVQDDETLFMNVTLTFDDSHRHAEFISASPGKP
nr:hypothetical protein [Segetibacter sp.]